MTNGLGKPSTSMVLEMLQKPSAQKGLPNGKMHEAMAMMKMGVKTMKGAEADRMQQLMEEMTNLIGDKGEVV